MPVCQVHYWRWLPQSRGSYCLLSRLRQTDTAVVFVHGFLGSSVDTWQRFQTMIDEIGDGLGWWAKCDLYFWQYDAEMQTIPNSASEFRKFLHNIVPAPKANLLMLTGQEQSSQLEWLRDPADYRHLILVAHSQGGVVVRQAIVDTVKEWKLENMPPVMEHSPPSFYRSVLGADVHLFSPALYGTSFGGLAALIYEIPPTRWLFDSALRIYSPSYKQLKPASAFLKSLETSTVQFSTEFGFPALDAHVYYADADGIIEDLVYATDRPPHYLQNQNHSSVCKPRVGYLEPMEVIRSATVRTNTAP